MHTMIDFQDLTEPQLKLLLRLEKEQCFTEHFYFTGGTLLKALGIVPRESNDLDFFTFPEVDYPSYKKGLSVVRMVVQEVYGADDFDETDRGFALTKEGTFIDCIHESTDLIGDTVSYGRLQTAGVQDIGASKAGALCSRDEIKDYIDIAFLTKRENWTLSDLERMAREKYKMDTITEEKLLEELLSKRDLFQILPERFLRNGNEYVDFVNQQINTLIEQTTL